MLVWSMEVNFVDKVQLPKVLGRVGRRVLVAMMTSICNNNVVPGFHQDIVKSLALVAILAR
jgi:branched-subunit amino acid transport protein